MVNRQIISAGEREALAAEAGFWQAIERRLRVYSPTDRLYQMETGPIPASKMEIDSGFQGHRFIFVDSTINFRKSQGCGNLHWLTTWRVRSEQDSSRLYILVATAMPVQRHLDQNLGRVLNGIHSVDEAITRLMEYKQNADQIKMGWDETFMNQPFGLPSPWTYLSGFWATDNGDIDNRVMNLLEMNIIAMEQYQRFWPEIPWGFVTEITENQHIEWRQSMAQRLIFTHTARSMWLRTIPRQTGVRHQAVNDAPSHNSTRVKLILRIKELFPDAYELCRHYLPTTTQHRLDAVRIKAAVDSVMGPTGGILTENLPARAAIPAKQKIKIPDNLPGLFGASSQFLIDDDSE